VGRGQGFRAQAAALVKVVAFVPDLMDRSRVEAAGGPVQWVSSPGQLAGTDADLVIVDLSRPGVLEVLGAVSAPTIGFASHVDRDLIEAARTAGCQQVLARSVFFRRLAELLGPA
jgi:hypothetical protein